MPPPEPPPREQPRDPPGGYGYPPSQMLSAETPIPLDIQPKTPIEHQQEWLSHMVEQPSSVEASPQLGMPPQPLFAKPDLNSMSIDAKLSLSRLLEKPGARDPFPAAGPAATPATKDACYSPPDSEEGDLRVDLESNPTPMSSPNYTARVFPSDSANSTSSPPGALAAAVLTHVRQYTSLGGAATAVRAASRFQQAGMAASDSTWDPRQML